MTAIQLPGVAFLGLGGMGAPMAQNILTAGYPLTVWNRNVTRADGLVKQGARLATAPGDIGNVRIVITMLADDDATRDIAFGQGMLDALTPDTLWLNMATVSVALTQELAEAARQRGVRYIAAPVLGRVDVAAAGQLNILVAGEQGAVTEVQPLLEVLGSKTWCFGADPAQAIAVKLGVNFMLASAIESMGEAAALVRAYDVEPADFLQMTGSTLFSAPAFLNYGAMIAESRYQPAGFALPLGLKDILLAQQAAKEKRVPMGFASVLRDNFLDALAHGLDEHDWAALATVSARRAGQIK